MDVQEAKPEWRYESVVFDAYTLALCFSALATARVILRNYVIEPVCGSHFEVHNNLKAFSENAWNILYYVVSFGWGMKIFFEQEWSVNGRDLFFPDKGMSDEFHAYYMAQLAFYVLCLYCVVFTHVRRKDYWAMILHHGVTIALVAYSTYLGYTRAGLIVFLLHDSGDILLYLTRALNKWEKDSRGMKISFKLSILVLFVTRIGLYPYFLYLSSIDVLNHYDEPKGYYIFAALLYSLFLYHLAWLFPVLVTQKSMAATEKRKEE